MIRSVARPLRHEIDKIKGSRFMASIVPVETRDAATGVVDGLRAELREATHHCFAWRLGTDPEAKRASDDGEPSGTAGRPILQEIDGRGLTDVIVVVTRWYGGTKLGTGGLLRAYAGAAAAGLDRAEIVERPIVEALRLSFAYGLTGPVQGVLAAHDLEPIRAEYGADVTMELAVPVETVATVRDDLSDATHGAVRWSDGGSGGRS